MDETENKQAPKGADVGNVSQEPTLIEQTNQAAERLEKANAAQAELLERQELMYAQSRISGRAHAGSQPEPEETEHEKWAREAKIRYAGTGMDPTE